MRKVLLIFMLLLSIFKVADSIKYNTDTIYKIDEVTITISKWDLLINQIIQVESNGNNNAIGDNGRAIGCMQIHTIMVDEVNRISGLMYTYNDRYSQTKSIEMFNIYQEYWNPYKDLITALQIWNGGSKCRLDYYTYLTEDYLNKFEI